MLYYIGYSTIAGGWTGDFNRAVTGELDRWAVRYMQLPPYDWAVGSPPLAFYRNFTSSEDDVWLVAWAQSPVVELIRNKPGRKYGFAAGLTAIPFEPARLWGHLLHERERLGCYDGIFLPSEWSAAQARNHYPELGRRLIVTGFPVDFEALFPYRWEQKIDRLVVFNQRFATEKLPALEIQLAHRLIARGHRVWHLTEQPPAAIARQGPEIARLLAAAHDAGVRIVYNPTKHIYYRRLAMAQAVVTTSLADTLSVSLIEGIALGAAPVAPRAMVFPEYVHDDNLYSPYDLDEIERLAIDPPQRRHDIYRYCKQRVGQRMIAAIYPEVAGGGIFQSN
ncbi:MAG: hypothetical protein ACM3XN_10975 [Chloroflexota bacterium]